MTKPESASPKKSWLDSWHVNPSANREYDFIDGLRGLAILMVLCCHGIYVNPKSGNLSQSFGTLTQDMACGVKLFFVISGFLISWPFWKKKFAHSNTTAPRGYLSRRFWKIYPPLALSIVILTVVAIYTKRDWSYLVDAAQWLSCIAFFVPVSGKLNPVMWTLVVEVQFYLFLPMVFFGMKKASMTTSLWIVTLIFLVIPWIFVELTGLGPTFLPSINSHFPSALGNFYFGILIAGLDCQGLLRKKWANFGLIGLLLFPVCLFSLAWLQIYEFDLFTKLEPSLICLEYVSFACLLLFVANPQHWIARILCTNWLRWCGIVSYEWYLFHQPILLGFRSYMGQAGGNITKYSVMVFGGILISALTAALVYRFFSLPILKYGRSNK